VSSPFLSSLDNLLQARACIAGEEVKSGTAAADKAGIDHLIAEIDSYVAMLRGVAAVVPKAAGSPQPNQPKSADGTASVPSASAPAPSASPTPSLLLAAVLSGDGLAQKLGVVPATGLLPDKGPWRHVLLLKALESGGTVEKTTNIFRSKIRYSGGSVDTYALFTLEGELECSGNVYDYGGSIPAKEFQTQLRDYNPEPAKQFIFQRGSCHVPAGH
jgi:hypothetical protein